MGRRRDEGDSGGEGRPVEPGEARAHGNDPEDVRYREGGDLGAGTGRRETGGTGDYGYGGTRDDRTRGEGVPRRVEDVRGERGPDIPREPRVRSYDESADRRGTDRDDGNTERGTSWVSVILGLLTALGAGLILSGIVSAVVGAILGASGAEQGATEGGISGIVGLLITLLLAFVIGGYTAGRLASRSGLKHGLLVPALALLVTVLLGVIGAVLSANLLDNLSGITLPRLPNDAPQNLGTLLTGAGIIALLAPFVGGAIGGALGARTGRRRP